ncbi:MAG: hypothetical protein F6K37_35235 [Moorea sp. SIO4E2]|uniref:nitrate/nitrite transporter NrtS n=1 Tax=Moorena sp. SIO4E2 TaxID=2607826 RepID=UPI0013BD88F8|nr:nitrate/nitrite transporter NrtS [Moorena sp. SIO4E2]NEQ10978.1 hypothetical protein [Moorena sp. SIO4E2]
MKSLKEFCLSVVDLELMPTALRVALVVGSVLFVINHGSALLQGQMTQQGASHFGKKTGIGTHLIRD